MTRQEIKHRINSIKETVKITKAMYSISVSKMRKAEEKCITSRKFYNAARCLLAEALDSSADMIRNHTFVKSRNGNKTGYVVIAGDKGMCGDYNHKILETVLADMHNDREKYVFTVGQMAREFFERQGVNIDLEYLHLVQNPHQEDAESIAQDIISLYKQGLLDEVYVAYTAMPTPSSTEVRIEKLLPIDTAAIVKCPSDRAYSLSYEPTVSEAIDNVVTAYISGTFYYMLTEASMSEHFSRMEAMPQATKNGEEMMAELTAKYNHIRQESITRELTDVYSARQD